MNISQLISDALSVITISMCLFLKVPQISSILKMKSAAGMNIFSLLMELASYSTTTCYNYVNKYSLLSYLEYPIIISQLFVLIYLVMSYQKLINQKTIIIAVVYFATVFCFLTEILSPHLLTFLVPFCTPVSLSSKGIQLWEILSKMNADAISVSTWIISALTNISRIYTIYMDSADLILLTNFSLSAIMSTSIAVLSYMLQNNQIPKKD